MADQPQTTEEHWLKTWIEFWPALESGAKTFEVRRNDRGFRVGDTLVLECFDPETQTRLAIKPIVKRVTYILDDYSGLVPGYVVMGLQEP